MAQPTLTPSGYKSNQSNRMQTYRQSDVSQVRETVHKLVNSIHTNTKTSQLQKLFFTKRFFPLCYTPPSIETPLRMTIVLFSSGGGGSVFFFCKREITKFNMTSLPSLCTSVVFLWSLCKSAHSGATVNTENAWGLLGETGKGDATEGPSFSCTLKKMHTPCPTQVVTVCFMWSI